MKRWLIRIAALLLLICLLAVGAIEWVLRSDLPRQLVERAVGDQLDAGVSIEQVSVGWWGRTTVKGVTVAEPLSDEVIARLPHIEVVHRTLVGLVVMRSLDLAALEVAGGAVHVREDRHGRWNVERMSAPALKDTGGEGAGTLPRVRIEGVGVAVDRANGRRVSLGNVGLTLRPVSASGPFELAARSETLGEVHGRIDPSLNFTHDLHFELRRLQVVARLWTDEPAEPIAMSGRWHGRKTQQGLVGHLNVQQARYGTFRAGGGVDLEAGEGRVALVPSDVRIEGLPGAVGAVRMTGGRLTLASDRFEARELRIKALGGEIEAEGSVRLADRSGEAAVRWHGVGWPQGVGHSGQVMADWAGGMLGRYTGRVRYRLNGAAGTLPMAAAGEADLTFPPDRGLEASLGFDRLTLEHPSAALQFDGLSARLTIDEQTAAIDDLRLAGASDVEGEARIAFDEGRWTATLSAASLPIEGPELPPVALDFSAEGAGRRVTVNRLRLEGAGLTAAVEGDYDPDRQEALRSRVKLDRQAGLVMQQGGTTFATEGLSFAGRVTGSLKPIDLRLEGAARSASLQLGAHQREALELPVTGGFTEGRLWLRGEPVRLLDGSWSIEAGWEVEGGVPGARLEMSEVALRRFDDVVGYPLELSGTLEGALELSMPAFDAERLKLEGLWRIVEPGWHGFRADVSTGRLHLLKDGLSLEELEVRRGEGMARGSVRIDPRRNRAKVVVETQGWPLDHADLPIDGTLDAKGDVAVELETLAMEGAIDLGATIDFAEQRLMALTLTGRMAGRRIVLDRLEGRVLGGKLSGEGVADLDQPLNSDLIIKSEGLVLRQLAGLTPELDELAGAVDLTFELRPTSAPRAPAPMVGRLSLKGDDSAWRDLTLLAGEAEVYVVPTTGPSAGSGRWVDRLLLKQSRWRFGQGELGAWGRLTWRDEGWFYYAQTEMTALDIAAVGRSLSPKITPPAGKLSGSIVLTGPLDEPGRRYGKAQLKLSEADLANEGLIAGIYNLFNLDLSRKPTGEGQATLWLSGDGVTIRRAHYSNRGVKNHFGGSLADITKGRDSTVNGHAIAVAEVLPDLPLMAQIGEAIGAVQNYVNAVRFDGTLAEPNVRWVPLQQLKSAARSLVPQQ